MDSLSTDSEEGSRLSLRATQHGRHLSAYLRRRKGLRYTRFEKQHLINLLYFEALSNRIYPVEDVSQHHGPRGTGKVSHYIKRMALKMCSHLSAGGDQVRKNNFLSRFV